MTGSRPAASVGELARALASGDRSALAKAITLMESTRAEDASSAAELLAALPPRAAGEATQRVGITGVPGVGKSSFIDALGHSLIQRGHRVAVLAVDPSSQLTGGSLLGDKTRMQRLAADPAAFVRPSPAGETHGGVARRTREAAALCEAAGYDVVLVETIGTGQSEVAVASMVDTFVLLALAGAGDELQGIKRGVMELADVVVVNKADGATRAAAERAAAELTAALSLLRGGKGEWQPPVLTASALTGDGVAAVWDAVQRHRHHLGGVGLDEQRRRQALQWFDSAWRERLLEEFAADPANERALADLRQHVRDGAMSPSAAAAALLARRRR